MIPKNRQPGPLEERPPPEVRERLLRFGGRDACRLKVAIIPREQLEERLLREGALIDSKGAVFWEGEPSQRHSDIFKLWREAKLSAICYGYKLTNDGLWREHWWGISKDEQFVETTAVRDLYFGLRFQGASADGFVDCVLGNEPDPADPDVGR